MKKITLLSAVLFLCFSDASAQSKSAKADSVFDKYFAESSAQYWAGVALDYCSSLNKREANPLFQNRQGQISGAKFFGINAGIYALTVALQNKYPGLLTLPPPKGRGFPFDKPSLKRRPYGLRFNATSV